MFVLAWGGAAGFRFGRMPLDKSAALEPVDQKTGSAIRTGKLVVNLDTRVVSVDDLPVRLTGMEYGILELLSLRKGTPSRRRCFSTISTAAGCMNPS
jgi:DNA-binding response OmpR family regulator